MAIRVYFSQVYGHQIPEYELWVSRAEFGKGDLAGLSPGQWVHITKFIRMRPWSHFVASEQGIALLRAHPATVGPIAEDGSWTPMHCGTAWTETFPELRQAELPDLERYLKIEIKTFGSVEMVLQRAAYFAASLDRWTWVVSVLVTIVAFLATYVAFDPSRESYRVVGSALAAFLTFIGSLLGVEQIIRCFRSG